MSVRSSPEKEQASTSTTEIHYYLINLLAERAKRRRLGPTVACDGIRPLAAVGHLVEVGLLEDDAGDAAQRLDVVLQHVHALAVHLTREVDRRVVACNSRVCVASC